MRQRHLDGAATLTTGDAATCADVQVAGTSTISNVFASPTTKAW
jgi:hypothetical protein